MIRTIQHNGRWVVLTVTYNGFHYMAYDYATYDGPGCPLGIGGDEKAAINDWKEQT